MAGVAQLPNCACRDRCQFPQLPRATGHHCPGCMVAIHAVCGILDETASLDASNWCFDCWDTKNQRKKPPPAPTTKMQRKEPPPAPTGKAATKNPAKRKSSSTRPKKLKNKIILPSGSTNADPFVRTRVAFHLDGKERPDWLFKSFFLFQRTQIICDTPLRQLIFPTRLPNHDAPLSDLFLPA
jgi:hypothetical protein